MSLLGVSIITCAVLYGLLAVVLLVAFWLAEIPLFFSFAIVIVVIILQFLLAPFITDLTQKWFYKTNFW
jgi:antibiotic biosynthesis monooxygenase (ABM) superfamily enzyme